MVWGRFTYCRVCCGDAGLGMVFSSSFFLTVIVTFRFSFRSFCRRESSVSSFSSEG